MRVIRAVPAYRGFEIVELSWEAFVQRWVPGLSKDGVRVGVNWSGPSATGYDVEPEEARRNVEAVIGDERAPSRCGASHSDR